MSHAVADISLDADLFRLAYPSWPHADLALIDWGTPSPDRCDVPGGCGHLLEAGCECGCCPATNGGSDA